MPDINNRNSKKTKGNKASARDNKIILAVLETVKAHYVGLRDMIHVNAYSRAIHALRKWPHPIKAGKEVAHLDGVGKGMVEKINIILATGTLPIIQEKQLVIIPESQIGIKTRKQQGLLKDDIRNVLGFGEKVANEFKRKYNVTTISGLRRLITEYPNIKLTTIQRLGLEHHDDLALKIPRAEITQIGHDIVNSLKNEDKDVMVFLAGSYPSGLKTESKDIDILLVTRNAKDGKNKKIHLADLAHAIGNHQPLETISIGTNKFLGLVKQGNREDSNWRHLDMRLVDMLAFPFAWMYYVSGVEFNKLIREKLKKRGYKLNEWGLFYSSGSRVKLEGEKGIDMLEKEIKDNADLLEYAIKIEKEIFKLAGMEYQSVRERY